MDKPDEAYSHFQAAAEINPRDPMSRSNLGAYLQEHGHVNEAIEQYKRVITLTSDPGLAGCNVCQPGHRLSHARRRSSRRKKIIDQALRLNPSQANAYLGLGSVDWKGKKRLAEAIENYSRAVEIAPN